MKIIIAPDSFKGSLSAIEVGASMKKAFKQEVPHSQVEVIPMADGGEGTLETLVFATNGKRVPVEATGPLGEKVLSEYGVLGDGETVVIEMAAIAGLPMVPEEKRNPMNTTSFGVGEVILEAMNKGYRQFIVGLGGSATNDGGLGMLQALGVAFFDEKGEKVEPYGRSVNDVAKVNFDQLSSLISECSFTIASDVDNPLCGEKGASYVFGPQKGATKEQVEKLDLALSKYGNVIERSLGESFQNVEGAGAAGGLGFGFLLLGGKIVSGAKVIAEVSGLEEAIKEANWVITGEGQSDFQTLYGKVPSYVAKIAKKHHVPISLISGSLGKGYQDLYEDFISCHSIATGPMDLKACMTHAEELLYHETRNLARILRVKA